MQSQNNHIEDLVRQAAEFNSVKAKGADWESVFNQLKNNKEASEKGGEKSKKYLFLLLFLLSSLLCNEFYYILTHNGSKTNLNKQSIESVYKENEQGSLITFTDKGDQKLQIKNFKSLKSYSNPVYSHSSATALESVAHHNIADATNEEKEYLMSANNSGNEVNAQIFPEDVLYNVANKNSEDPYKSEEQKIPVKTEPAKQKRFYAAFLLGPDISTVKFSEIKAAGHSIGITAGINLSRRLSVEAGAFLDQKKYVAEGDYFKAEKLYLPDHSKLLNVSGYCNMIEIPLNIRYNVRTTSNYNLFALAGVSSYLLQKENYDYEYTRYNNYYSSNKSYSKSSNEFFNVVNLAAGFEKRVGKTTALRIEPYVKLPVSGMGVGDMRLSSAGVLVGIRYPF